MPSFKEIKQQQWAERQEEVKRQIVHLGPDAGEFIDGKFYPCGLVEELMTEPNWIKANVNALTAWMKSLIESTVLIEQMSQNPIRQ